MLRLKFVTKKFDSHISIAFLILFNMDFSKTCIEKLNLEMHMIKQQGF